MPLKFASSNRIKIVPAEFLIKFFFFMKTDMYIKTSKLQTSAISDMPILGNLVENRVNSL